MRLCVCLCLSACLCKWTFNKSVKKSTTTRMKTINTNFFSQAFHLCCLSRPFNQHEEPSCRVLALPARRVRRGLSPCGKKHLCRPREKSTKYIFSQCRRGGRWSEVWLIFLAASPFVCVAAGHSRLVPRQEALLMSVRCFLLCHFVPARIDYRQGTCNILNASCPSAPACPQSQ